MSFGEKSLSRIKMSEPNSFIRGDQSLMFPSKQIQVSQSRDHSQSIRDQSLIFSDSAGKLLEHMADTFEEKMTNKRYIVFFIFNNFLEENALIISIIGINRC